MKKTILLIAAFVTLTISSTYAQEKSTMPKELVADETQIQETPSGKTFKVISSNETISNNLIRHYSKTFELKYHFSFKKDRNGYYPEWVFYFPITKKQEVLNTIPK